MVTTAPEQVVPMTASTSVATSTFVTTALIPAGRVIVVAIGRGTATGLTSGFSALDVSAGAISGARLLASACRASTYDLILVAAQVTTAIPAGSTVTLTHRTNSAGKRGGSLSVWPDVTLPPVEDATSGTASDNTDGATSAGPNGSSTTESASTAAAMPAGDHVILAAHSYGGTSTLTEGAGYTLVDKSRTSSGSGDRGCLVEYANSSTSGVKTATATLSASGGWASVIATLPLSAPVTPPAPVRSVIVGGVKKPVTSISTIVGGVKKPTT